MRASSLFELVVHPRRLCVPRQLGSILAVSAALAVLCAPAHAQQAPSDGSKAASGDELMEIVVTAQKRQENLPKVPIAITAVSADALRDRNIQEAAELRNSCPACSSSRSTTKWAR